MSSWPCSLCLVRQPLPGGVAQLARWCAPHSQLRVGCRRVPAGSQSAAVTLSLSVSDRTLRELRSTPCCSTRDFPILRRLVAQQDPPSLVVPVPPALGIPNFPKFSASKFSPLPPSVPYPSRLDSVMHSILRRRRIRRIRGRGVRAASACAQRSYHPELEPSSFGAKCFSNGAKQVPLIDVSFHGNAERGRHSKCKLKGNVCLKHGPNIKGPNRNFNQWYQLATVGCARYCAGSFPFRTTVATIEPRVPKHLGVARRIQLRDFGRHLRVCT